MVIALGGVLAALYLAWGMSNPRGVLGRRSVRLITLQGTIAVFIGAAILILAVSAQGHDHTSDGVARSAQAHVHTQAETLAESDREGLDGHAIDSLPGDDMGMARSAGAAAHGHAPPTEDERACFAELASEAKVATARFSDINVAIAEGYVIAGDPTKTHMPNRTYMRDGRSLDLAYPETLIYRTDANGERRFVGVMYRAVKGHGPTPCGNATNWHTHGQCVAPDGMPIPERQDGTCPTGYEHRDGVIEMMHVWFVPRARGMS
jgi:hypothetical protein